MLHVLHAIIHPGACDTKSPLPLPNPFLEHAAWEVTRELKWLIYATRQQATSKARSLSSQQGPTSHGQKLCHRRERETQRERRQLTNGARSSELDWRSFGRRSHDAVSVSTCVFERSCAFCGCLARGFG